MFLKKNRKGRKGIQKSFVLALFASLRFNFCTSLYSYDLIFEGSSIASLTLLEERILC